MFTMLIEQYNRAGQSDSDRLRISKRMLEQSEKNNDSYEIFKANLYHGQSLYYMGRYTSSLNYCNTALSYSELFPYEPSIVLLYRLIGNCYYKCENIPLAIASYLDGIKIAKQMENTEYLHEIYENMAYLQILSNDYSEAVTTLYSASKLIPKDKQEELNASFYLQIFLSYCFFFLDKKDNLEETYSNANKAFLLRKSNSKRDSVHCYTIRTLYYLLKHGKVETKESFKFLLKFLRQDGFVDFDVLFMIIPIFIENKYLDEASNILQICKDAVLGAGSNKLETAYYSCMIRLSSYLRKEDQCNKFARLYHASSTAMDRERNFIMSEFIKQQYALQGMKEKISESEKITLTDPIAGTFNRQALNSIIKPKFDYAKQQGNAIGACCIRVKSFKEYNDRYGFSRGDECIGKIGKELLKITGPDTLAIRYTGVLFVLFFFNQSEDNMFAAITTLTQRVKQLNVENALAPEKIVTIESSYYYNYAFPVDTLETFIGKVNRSMYR